MSNFSFDSRGNLTPHCIIEIDESQFEHHFVRHFQKSATRPVLFDSHTTYNSKMSKIMGSGFSQWVDGSFSTSKEDPGDVDVVNIVSYGIYNLVHQSIDPLITEITHKKFRDHIHSFLVIKPEDGNPYKKLFEQNYTKWLSWFTKDKDDNPKGILELRVTQK